MSIPMRIVGTFKYEDGKFVSAESIDKNRNDFNHHKAVSIPTKDIAQYYPMNLKSRVKVGSALNQMTLVAGETYFIPGGRRIILEAKNQHILFIFNSNNKIEPPGFYIQSPQGFHQEWLDLVRISASKNLQGARILAEWEIQFLVGVVAGASWTGFAIVIGMTFLEEAITGKNRKAVTDLITMIDVLTKHQERLKKVAPTLESVLVDMFWLTLLKGQQEHLIPTMAKDPKMAARAAGTIAAKLGNQALDGRLTAASVIINITLQLVLKLALTVPNAAKKTVDQLTTMDDIEDYRKNLDNLLTSARVVVSKSEKDKIIEELKAHPIEIAAIFKDLKSDIMTAVPK